MATNAFDLMVARGATPAMVNIHGDKTGIIYNPLGIAGSVITGQFRETPQLTEESSEDGKEITRIGIIRFDPALISSPSDLDTFTIDGIEWAAKTITSRHPTLVYAIEFEDQVRIRGDFDEG